MSLTQPEKQEHATKLTLMGLFLTLFAAVAANLPLRRGARQAVELRPFDLAMLGMSTYRLGRLAAFDKVAEPLRQPFAETRPDETGAGETVEPRGTGVQRALGELISCPICAGTWIAAGLVYALQLFPGPTRLFLAMMSAIGIAELLNALTEALSWSGQAARKEAGTAES